MRNARKNLKTIGVIPARYASTRFPGKPLADIAGKPMVIRVYERCAEAGCLDELYIATDDDRIYRAVKTFGAPVLMTAAEHVTGTDRVAEVATMVAGDIFINIQGDEPLLPAATALPALCAPFAEDNAVVMTTLAAPIPSSRRGELSNPNVCKVVVNQRGNALYFSRAVVPFRHRPEVNVSYLRHVGVYAFRREFLLKFTTLPVTPLEVTEGLEMLRALEHGFPIRVVVGDFATVGVDTPEDLAAVVERYLAEEARG